MPKPHDRGSAGQARRAGARIHGVPQFRAGNKLTAAAASRLGRTGVRAPVFSGQLRRSLVGCRPDVVVRSLGEFQCGVVTLPWGRLGGKPVTRMLVFTEDRGHPTRRSQLPMAEGVAGGRGSRPGPAERLPCPTAHRSVGLAVCRAEPGEGRGVSRGHAPGRSEHLRAFPAGGRRAGPGGHGTFFSRRTGKAPNRQPGSGRRWLGPRVRRPDPAWPIARPLLG